MARRYPSAYLAVLLSFACSHTAEPAEASEPCSPMCSGLADWPMPNAHITGVPNWESYDTISEPGVVKDNVTGLAWQQPIDSTTYSFADAEALCTKLSLGGRADWRLPSVLELISLVNITSLAPSIDTDTFPGTPADYFWTSDQVFPNTSVWWAVNFNTGYANDNGAAAGTPRVRCVAGGLRAHPADAGTDRYVVGAATIDATKTKLTWQRSAPSSTFDWSAAMSYCQALTLDGTGWRLPTINELVSITDYARSNPALDPTYFADTSSDLPYWASSLLAGDPSRAWQVSAYSGNTFYSDVSSLYYARCVR